LIPWVLLGVSAATFSPVLHNGFVWDDYPLFVNNAFPRELSPDRLRWMFTNLDTGHYHPLSWMLLAAIHQVAGPEPRAYHLVGLFLHAVNGVLVFFLTRQLIASAVLRDNVHGSVRLDLCGGLAAMAFALHPLRVEVVAWAAALRDALCAAFYLLSLLCYLRGCRGRNRPVWIVAAVVSHAVALLSKPMAVSLPVVLLVLDVYPLRRLPGAPGRWWQSPFRRVLVEKLPFVLLSGMAAAVAPWAEMRAGALASLPVSQRIAQALFGIAFYLLKTVVPTGLSPLYELPHPFDPFAGRFVLSGVVVLTGAAVLVAMRRRWTAGAATFACYVAVLLPVLGLVHIGPFLAADRYTYLASIPWASLAGGLCFHGLGSLPDGSPKRRRVAFMSCGAVLLFGTWAILSYRQCAVWRDALTLWAHATSVDPSSMIARGNFATALAEVGRTEEAWTVYQRILFDRPGYPPAVHGLGYVRFKQGRYREAVAYYRLALPAMPRSAELHLDLAEVLTALGRREEAVEHYRRALAIWPSDLRARRALEGLSTRSTTGGPRVSGPDPTTGPCPATTGCSEQGRPVSASPLCLR